MFSARVRKLNRNPEERRRRVRRLVSQCAMLAVLKFTTFWLQGCFLGAILGALMSIIQFVAPLIGPGLQLATSIVGVVGQASAAANQQAAAAPVQQPGPGFVGQTPGFQTAANPLQAPAATPGANPPAQAAPPVDTNGTGAASDNAKDKAKDKDAAAADPDEDEAKDADAAADPDKDEAKDADAADAADADPDEDEAKDADAADADPDKDEDADADADAEGEPTEDDPEVKAAQAD